ncbi:MAG: C39 family peptidase [Thermodesulfobacteriota bacterium]
METRLHLEMLPQPDDATCGPTCLHALYRYYGDPVPLAQVIAEVPSLATGGTIAVFLACHALKRGYQARIFTYNLHMFDPTWFVPGGPGLARQLAAQATARSEPRLTQATGAYLEFLSLGGELRFEDLTAALVRHYLKRGVPILTGLSATYLYRSVREVPGSGQDSDVAGEPAGHFVVLCGYDADQRAVLVADPFLPNPVSGRQVYLVGIERVLGAILLGILTHDANFLVIQPKAHANPHRRQ